MKVKVNEARFLVSAADERHWPAERVPEVAFAGRSNVGKSSLINCLVGGKTLARVSSTPGRTRTVNFLDLYLAKGLPLKRLRFVDLPGYGFAKVAQKERRRWGPMVESYLTGREDLALVVLIVDSRRPPTTLDEAMAAWLNEIGRHWVCVATKSDKLPKTKRRAATTRVERALGIPPGQVICFSAEKGAGRDDLWRRILIALTEQASTDRASTDR